ncbi:MAG: lysophospholipid acyltransferase family protein [Candidatus Omnitrophota bacterium]
MRIVISILVWIAIGILTILLFFACLFFTVVLFPFDKDRKIVHAQSFWWANALIAMNPYWNLDVRGLENIDRSKTYVIVANHQSLADIVVIYKIHTQFKWVAKDSILKIPFLGGVLLLGNHVLLSRGKFGSIKQVYRKAAKWLRKDMSVLFFPEGTRSETDEMNKFQNGAFKLAIKEKRPILPISISGTRDAIPKGDWIFKTKVFGRLEVFPPIDTGAFKPAEFGKLRDMVYTQLKEASERK